MQNKRLTEVQREGLFHGQNGINPELGLDRLGKRREQNMVALGRTVNSQVSDLRTSLASAERRGAAARRHFSILDAEAHGEAPSLVWPLLGLLFSAALTVGDSFLLAPLLQGIGIVDPIDQRLIALLMGAGLTAFAHLGFHLWHSGRKVLGLVVLVIAAGAVGSICWWRCDQIIFAASLGNETWHAFLVGHPVSTRLFVVALSVILPFAAGFVSSHVLPDLQFSARWYAARRATHRWGSRCTALRERLNAAEVDAKLAARDIELQHEIDRIQYRIHHHLGNSGSRQNAGVVVHD
jgi:hypothetical protein